MKKICIRKYELNAEDRPGQGCVKIVFLSDLHDKFQGSEGKKIMDLIHACSPDVVLIGGDVIIGLPDEDVLPAAEFVKRIAREYPVWYANGNHEQRIRLYPERFGDMWKKFEQALQDDNIHRLVNEKETITVKGCPLTIYGFEPDRRFYRKGRKQSGLVRQLEQVYGRPDKDRYSILLAHHPKYYEDYFSWGADLTLSGHYHGGVILLGKNTGVITPDFRIFSRCCCGKMTRGHSTMIVSAGTGEHTVPFRIHNPREVTFLKINFGKNEVKDGNTY